MKAQFYKPNVKRKKLKLKKNIDQKNKYYSSEQYFVKNSTINSPPLLVFFLFVNINEIVIIDL